MPSTVTHPRRAPRPSSLRSARAHRPHVLALMLRGARGRHWTFNAGAGLLVLIVAILLLTPWIAPHDPASQNLIHRLAGP